MVSSSAVSRSAIAVFLVALGVRVAFVHESIGTPGWFWHTAEGTAMAAQAPVVNRMRSGDLVVADPRQAPQPWQRAAGPPPAWDALCGNSFRDPAGGYYLRAIGGVVAPSAYGHKMLLALLGALTCVAIGAAASAFAGPRAGIGAGLLAALYAPLVAADGVLLGDVPALGLIAAGVALAVRAARDGARRGPFFAGAGALLALAVSLRGIAWVPLALLFCWLVIRVARGRLPRAAPPLFAAGLAVGFAPFAIRDVAAGAVPLAPACLAVARFAVEEPLLAGETVAVPMSRGAAIATGVGHRLARPRLLARNLLAFASEIESPDADFSFEPLRQRSSVLFLLPRFSWLLLLAAIGAVVWRFGAAEHRPGTASGLVLALVAASVVALAFVGPAARARLPLLLPPFVVAGWLLARFWEWGRECDWTRCSRAAAAVLAARFLWFAIPPPHELRRAEVRLDDFVIGGFLLAERRDFEGADEEFERAWRLLLSRASPEEAVEVALKVRKGHLLVFFTLGELGSAEDDWEALRKTIPDDPLVREVGRVLGKTP